MNFSCPTPIAPAPAAAAPPPVRGDGFFPDIDVARMHAELRVRDLVTAPRVRAAIVAAMLAVDLQLADWADARRDAGLATLAAVPARTIDGESRLVHLYRRAVGALARAELIETHRDVDLTAAGQRRAEDAEPAAADLRRDAQHAVRDMLGIPRTSIELI